MFYIGFPKSLPSTMPGSTWRLRFCRPGVLIIGDANEALGRDQRPFLEKAVEAVVKTAAATTTTTTMAIQRPCCCGLVGHV